MKALGLLLAMATVFNMTTLALCQEPAPATRPARLMGTLVKVEGRNLIVNARQGTGEKEVVVALPDDAEIRIDGEIARLEDLKPQTRLTILPTPATTRRPARLLVSATSRGLPGTIVRIDGASVIMTTRQPGAEPREVTVVTNEQTQVIFPGVTANGVFQEPRRGKFDELKPDMRIQVIPESGPAAKIYVFPNLPARQPQ